MTMRTALGIAKKICGKDCNVCAHYGYPRRKDRAIRLTGNVLRVTGVLAWRLAVALPGGRYRQDADTILVWFE